MICTSIEDVQAALARGDLLVFTKALVDPTAVGGMLEARGVAIPAGHARPGATEFGVTLGYWAVPDIPVADLVGWVIRHGDEVDVVADEIREVLDTETAEVVAVYAAVTVEGRSLHLTISVHAGLVPPAPHLPTTPVAARIRRAGQLYLTEDDRAYTPGFALCSREDTVGPFHVRRHTIDPPIVWRATVASKAAPPRGPGQEDTYAKQRRACL